jgi:DNA replication protein DnaD
MDMNEALLWHEGFYFEPDYSGSMHSIDMDISEIFKNINNMDVSKLFEMQAKKIKQEIEDSILPTKTIERLSEKYWLFGGIQ